MYNVAKLSVSFPFLFYLFLASDNNDENDAFHSLSFHFTDSNSNLNNNKSTRNKPNPINLYNVGNIFPSSPFYQMWSSRSTTIFYFYFRFSDFDPSSQISLPLVIQDYLN